MVIHDDDDRWETWGFGYFSLLVWTLELAWEILIISFYGNKEIVLKMGSD